MRSCGRLIGERYSTAVTAGAYYFRARIYYRLHDPERARADVERAYDYFTITVNTHRRVPDSYANRAVILYWLERYDEAIADYDRAIAAAGASNDSSGTRVRSKVADRRAGQLADLHYARANVFFRRGDWTSAIAGYDQAAALDPDDSDFQGARCEGRAAANTDLETAAQACEAAISLSEGEDGHFSRGLLHFTQGRYEAAHADFAAAYAEDDEDYDALYGRGVAAVKLGRQAEGEADIAAAREESLGNQLEFYVNAGLRP